MNRFCAHELHEFLTEIDLRCTAVISDEPEAEDDSVTFDASPWLHVQVNETFMCTVQEFNDDEGGHYFIFGAEREDYDTILCDVVDILKAA